MNGAGGVVDTTMVTYRHPTSPTTTRIKSTSSSTTTTTAPLLQRIFRSLLSTTTKMPLFKPPIPVWTRPGRSIRTTSSTTTTTKTPTITTRCQKIITLMIVVSVCELTYFYSNFYYNSSGTNGEYSPTGIYDNHQFSSFLDTQMILPVPQQQQQQHISDSNQSNNNHHQKYSAIHENITMVHSIYDLSNHHDTTATTLRRMTSPPSSPLDNNIPPNISTAVCYKALFGTSIDIGIILQWIGTWCCAKLRLSPSFPWSPLISPPPTPNHPTHCSLPSFIRI